MLNNINSIKITKHIFSFTDEKRKLNTIKYNKSIQIKLDIDIIFFRLYSGKFIIYDKNNIGKIYKNYVDGIIYEDCIELLSLPENKDKLIFEGEYLNRKKNGKGKEYDNNGDLLFEGEYLNGKKNGKGKLYNNLGIIIFEGAYLNNKKNGKGKEYYNNGDLLFEGEYLDDKKNGKGKEYYDNGEIKFEGNYLKGKIWNGMEKYMIIC